jgi:hypothetical protein
VWIQINRTSVLWRDRLFVVFVQPYYWYFNDDDDDDLPLSVSDSVSSSARA